MITFIKGDATCPQAKGHKIIAHCVNSIGGWGKGFVLAISKRWKLPESEYRAWYRSKDNFTLGSIQLIQVESWIQVCNMLAQHGIRGGSNGPPIRYKALEDCLINLAREAKILGASIHMPKGMGSGLAGGNFNKIVEIVEKTLCAKNIKVTMYDYDK